MTDEAAVEQLQAVRIFCDPAQVQAIDRAIAVLRENARKEQKTHPVG